MSRDLEANLRTISRARIYFGHHSVGDNMLSGVRQIANELGSADIQIVKFEPGATLPESFLAHSRVGTNKDPLSKLEGFARVLDDKALARLDLALMKFCYVDFEPSTDVSSLYDRYRAQLQELETRFPGVCFLHATVPLKVHSTSFKNRIKRLLQQPVWEDDSNARRCEFNELLRNDFQEARVVDIARVEATGSQTTLAEGGHHTPFMRADLSNDGGHPNELGERCLAAEMLTKLGDNLR